jgi:hypothetical protein
MVVAPSYRTARKGATTIPRLVHAGMVAGIDMKDLKNMNDFKDRYE